MYCICTLGFANPCEFLVIKVHEVANLKEYRLGLYDTSKPNSLTMHNIQEMGVRDLPWFITYVKG